MLCKPVPCPSRPGTDAGHFLGSPAQPGRQRPAAAAQPPVLGEGRLTCRSQVFQVVLFPPPPRPCTEGGFGGRLAPLQPPWQWSCQSFFSTPGSGSSLPPETAGDVSNCFLLAPDASTGGITRVGSEAPRGLFKEQQPTGLSLPSNCPLRREGGSCLLEVLLFYGTP